MSKPNLVVLEFDTEVSAKAFVTWYLDCAGEQEFWRTLEFWSEKETNERPNEYSAAEGQLLNMQRGDWVWK